MDDFQPQGTEFRPDRDKLAVGGVRRLKAIFYETAVHPSNSDKANVVYTLKDHDHKGYPSLYRLFMEMEDVTEWEFATTYLESWEHWEMLCKCSWFKPYVGRWRKELNLKLRAKAFRYIKRTADGEAIRGQESLKYGANKYLLENGWIPKEEVKKETKKNHTATKDEIKEYEQNQLDQELDKFYEEDFDRIQTQPN